MKINDVREMSSSELEAKEVELKQELFKLRFQNSTGQLANPMKIKSVKRDIAKIKTILRERELKGE